MNIEEEEQWGAHKSLADIRECIPCGKVGVRVRRSRSAGARTLRAHGQERPQGQ